MTDSYQQFRIKINGIIERTKKSLVRIIVYIAVVNSVIFMHRLCQHIPNLPAAFRNMCPSPAPGSWCIFFIYLELSFSCASPFNVILLRMVFSTM